MGKNVLRNINQNPNNLKRIFYKLLVVLIVAVSTIAVGVGIKNFYNDNNKKSKIQNINNKRDAITTTNSKTIGDDINDN